MNLKTLVLGSLFLSSTISANNLHITSLESDFTQTIVNDQNSKITYTGKMYATSAKNQALWEYNSPIVKKIYYKGGKELVIIEPELEQVIYAKLNKVPNILKLLQSARKISANKLQTKFNGLTYNIDINGNKIEKISYIDEMQNKVVILFANEKVNGIISSSRFAYTIPADYDILEQ
jgi:outer membrane lipoprotein carrier protein